MPLQMARSACGASAVLAALLACCIATASVAREDAAHGSGATPTSRSLSKDSRELYILPLLVYGPNNQIQQLKTSLTLANVLGGTVLLTGIFEHYSDKYSRKGKAKQTFIPLETMFDRDSLASTGTKVVRVQELRELGWDGRIDAALVLEGQYAGNKLRGDAGDYIPMLRQAANISVPDMKNMARVEWSSHTLCNKHGVQQLRSTLQRFRVVVVYPPLNGAGNERWPSPFHRTPSQMELRAGDAANVCQRGFLEANRALQASRPLRDMAAQYIQDKFGGQAFVAAHVRPYPDTCLAVWASPDQPSLQQLSKPTCRNGGLMVNLAAEVLQLMRARGVAGLYVMAPPSIRWRIDAIFSRVNVTVNYLEADSPAVQKLAAVLSGGDRTVTNTALMLAEQAIAVHAGTFIGSSDSSCSWTILHERVAGRQLGGSAKGHGVTEELFFTTDLSSKGTYDDLLDMGAPPNPTPAKGAASKAKPAKRAASKP